jgi:hypothetical protein
MQIARTQSAAAALTHPDWRAVLITFQKTIAARSLHVVRTVSKGQRSPPYPHALVLDAWASCCPLLGGTLASTVSCVMPAAGTIIPMPSASAIYRKMIPSRSLPKCPHEGTPAMPSSMATRAGNSCLWQGAQVGGGLQYFQCVVCSG